MCVLRSFDEHDTDLFLGSAFSQLGGTLTPEYFLDATPLILRPHISIVIPQADLRALVVIETPLDHIRRVCL